MNVLSILSWLGSFAIASLIAPLVIRLYKRLRWIDDPTENKHVKTVHDRPVPRGGGLVVAAGIIAGLGLSGTLSQELTGVLLGALLLLISGTLDDRYDINPYLRYIINVIAACCVVWSGLGIDFITNPFSEGVIWLNTWNLEFPLGVTTFTLSLPGDLLTILWIVWNMNAVNWAKGVDGQLPGFVAIAAFVIALLSLRFSSDLNQFTVTALSLAVSGAYAGLLLWNFYPQKMMPGYAAGSLAGYFLAVLAFLSGAKLATVLLLLALPTADGIFTVTRRLAAGKSPFWGDRGHLHHRMLDAGWGKRRIAIFYWLATLIFGLVALQLDSKQKLYAMMAAGALFLALLVWFTRSITSLKPHDQDSGSKM
jgi:UDP-GlcNAc:undecaprenyl-phosphate GlcNAc-1-phosphate transferase